MNREITFRGKQYLIGEWIYGSLLRVDDNSYIVQNDDVEVDGHHLIFITDTPMLVEKETVGQFTGLLDKNGIEIYEGDIVGIGITSGFVEWNDKIGSWCIHLAGKSKNGGTPLGEMILCYDIHVIGNIHDNPELIEE